MDNRTASDAATKTRCKVIAMANQKGGVSKTTSTVNLGIGLARKGQRVLLVDADAQGSLTASLGFQDPDNMDYTLATVLGKIIFDKPFDPEEGLLHHQEGIDLMPGNIETSGLEVSLVNVLRREYVLKEYIDSLKSNYDWIIIDCPPSLGMMSINALAAADSVLIPVQTGYLPAKGLEQLIKTIRRIIRQKINPRLEIEGILLTMVDRRSNYSKEIIKSIEEGYGGSIQIFEKERPMLVRVSECSALGMSIYKKSPRCKAAIGYESLTNKIMEKAWNGGDPV